MTEAYIRPLVFLGSGAMGLGARSNAVHVAIAVEVGCVPRRRGNGERHQRAHLELAPRRRLHAAVPSWVTT